MKFIPENKINRYWLFLLNLVVLAILLFVSLYCDGVFFAKYILKQEDDKSKNMLNIIGLYIENAFTAIYVRQNIVLQLICGQRWAGKL